jgi:hypothetical protein
LTNKQIKRKIKKATVDCHQQEKLVTGGWQCLPAMTKVVASDNLKSPVKILS